VARECIFCEGRAGSGEHMFPDWLNPVLEQLPFTPMPTPQQPQWARGVVDFRSGESFDQSWEVSEIASLRNKKLCHGCNTGWMAQLEDRAWPLLTPMILGRAHGLTQDQQITVATWATKTVMVMETAMGGPPEYFSQEQRKIVMEHDRPPGLLRVRAACLEGPIPPLRYSCARLQIQREGVDFFEIHLYTLQMNTLVLQVIRPHPPPPNYGALKELAVPEEIEIPVFPPVDGFFWPPEKSLSPDGMSGYVTRTSGPPTLPGP
jgi:hypothetical protein